MLTDFQTIQIYAIHEKDFTLVFASESELPMLETLRDREALSGTRRQKKEAALAKQKQQQE